jgi:RES domain-containing protein
VIVWRIVKRKYATRTDLLAGLGAKESGGRWNAPGLPAVYASTTASLALLETLVHADIRTLPPSLVAAQIVVPDDASSRELTVADLHPGWRTVGDKVCIDRGTAWLRSGESLVLYVPSAVNPLERNVIVNPAHREIKRCKLGEIVDVQFDDRLLSLFQPLR